MSSHVLHQLKNTADHKNPTDYCQKRLSKIMGIKSLYFLDLWEISIAGKSDCTCTHAINLWSFYLLISLSLILLISEINTSKIMIIYNHNKRGPLLFESPKIWEPRQVYATNRFIKMLLWRYLLKSHLWCQKYFVEISVIFYKLSLKLWNFYQPK